MTNAPQPKISERLSAVVIKLLFGWVYAVGLSQLVLRLNRLPADPLRQIPAILAVLILLSLLTWGRYQLLALSGIVTITGLMLWLTHKEWLPDAGLSAYFDPLGRRISWAVNYLLGYSGGSEAELAWLAMVICLLLAVLAYVFLVRFNSPLTAGLVLVITAILARGLEKPFLYGWSLPAALVFIAALARHQRKTYYFRRKSKGVLASRFMLQSLPVAAAVLALAMALNAVIPTSFFHSRQFEGLVDDLSGQISSMQWNQVDFPDFSIQQAGYYPLVDRLGGPAYLSDAPHLFVSGTDDTFLLRGSVSQIYDGQRWLQDPDRTYYRFDSPLWQSEQDDTYDLNRPDLYSARLTAAQFNKTINLSWSPIGLPTRTLFTAGKPLRVSLAQSDPFLAYFRPSGQLFSKHWIQPGQWVVMTGRVMRTEQANFAEMVSKIQAVLKPDEREIPDLVRGRYLQLPDLAEYRQNGLLQQLTDSLTAGLDAPYDKVQALRYFLMTSATYNLIVSVPPADVDFVTWFLETGEGYCVYFATALTMMSRLAGIPARYVEGYYVPPGSQGDIRIVTGRQAHAWTEVYLAGIGWITVDATPGNSNPQPDPTPGITPGVSPGVTVTPEPTPEPTPDPGVTGQPVLSPGADDPDDPDARMSPALVLWWLLLLPVLLGILLFMRIRKIKRCHDRAWIAGKLADPKRRIRFYWSEIKDLLHALGQDRQTGQTPDQFLLAQTLPDGWLAGREDLVKKAAAVLDQVLYSAILPSDEAQASLAMIYDILEETVRQNRSLWVWLWRGRQRQPHSDDGHADRFVIS
jgi:transglutaminase-like putative cysteine protease